MDRNVGRRRTICRASLGVGVLFVEFILAMYPTGLRLRWIRCFYALGNMKYVTNTNS